MLYNARLTYGWMVMRSYNERLRKWRLKVSVVGTRSASWWSSFSGDMCIRLVCFVLFDQQLIAYRYSSCCRCTWASKSLMLRRFKSDLDEIGQDCSLSKYASIDKSDFRCDVIHSTFSTYFDRAKPGGNSKSDFKRG